MEKQLRELSFVVVNTGNAETGTMEIFFNFPVGVRIYDKRCVKQINNIEPDAPMIGSVFREFNSLNMMHYLSPGGGLNIPQLYCWDLTKCLSKQKIALTSQSLVHNVQRALKFKYPPYIDTAQCGSFAINWQICAAGSPAPIKGVLNVVIESD